VLYPISALLAVTRRLEEVYRALLDGKRDEVDKSRVRFDEYNKIVGLPELLADAAKIAEQ
jgi:hypothetical protein